MGEALHLPDESGAASKPGTDLGVGFPGRPQSQHPEFDRAGRSPRRRTAARNGHPLQDALDLGGAPTNPLSYVAGLHPFFSHCADASFHGSKILHASP